MVSAREVGDNSELFDEIHALSNLNQADQLSRARDWSKRSWYNEDASTLVITLASLHHWSLLPQLWHNKVIRNTLWLIIDEIARYALHNNETQSLVHALPAELRKVEWDLALNFAIKEQSSELLHIFLAKKAKPSFKMIDALSNLYNAKGGEFYKEALSLLIRKVPWQQCLGFRSFDDWQDVIKRGHYQDNPSLFVIASSIMSSKDKIKFLSEAANNEKTAKVVKHMHLPKSALAKASPSIKKQYLMKDLDL